MYAALRQDRHGHRGQIGPGIKGVMQKIIVVAQAKALFAGARKFFVEKVAIQPVPVFAQVHRADRLQMNVALLR